MHLKILKTLLFLFGFSFLFNIFLGIFFATKEALGLIVLLNSLFIVFFYLSALILTLFYLKDEDLEFRFYSKITFISGPAAYLISIILMFFFPMMG